MNCTHANLLLPLYLSSELNPTLSAALETHIAECAACAQEIDQQSQLDTTIREALRSERIETAALDLRILSHISAESESPKQPPPRPAQPNIRRWIAIGAIAAVILLAAPTGYELVASRDTAAAYAAIARDHEREVTEHQRRAWVSEPRELTALAARQGVPESVLNGLAANGYRLMRGKVCRLHGRDYVHLVYTNGASEFSTFFRPANSAAWFHSWQSGPNRMQLQSLDFGAEHLASFQSAACGVYVVTDESSKAAAEVAGIVARSI